MASIFALVPQPHKKSSIYSFISTYVKVESFLKALSNEFYMDVFTFPSGFGETSSSSGSRAQIVLDLFLTELMPCLLREGSSEETLKF